MKGQDERMKRCGRGIREKDAWTGGREGHRRRIKRCGTDRTKGMRGHEGHRRRMNRCGTDRDKRDRTGGI
jgi:hypothetical protein